MPTKNAAAVPVLRDAVPGDLGLIAQLEECASDRPWLGEQLRLEFSVSGRVAWIAEHPRLRVPLGWMLLLCPYDARLPLGEWARVLRLVVDPLYRRMGIATRMLSTFEEYMIREPRSQRKRLVCDVPDYATDVHLLLRSLGWRAARVISGGAADGSDLYRFYRRIRRGT